MSINKQDLSDYATRGYNRVPLMREVLADLDTPVSTYLKLGAGPYSYLFESVQGGEKWGRYSIIGLPCRTVFTVSDHEVTVTIDGKEAKRFRSEDPLGTVREFHGGYRSPEVPGLPRFTGGIVGYFGYDTVRYVESRLGHVDKHDPLKTPDILLMVSEEVVVFDNLAGRLYIVVHVDPAQQDAWNVGNERLEELARRLRETRVTTGTVGGGDAQQVSEDDFQSGFSKEGFEAAVERSRQYIRDGDIMQVVLSQRLSIPFSAAPSTMYRALRTVNPSPYMYFLDLDGFQIVGSSPEILVRLEDGTVTVRPIAGTRRRGHDKEDDLRLEQELMADPKELAEHLMLVDLGRNDVGRVASTGSVILTEKMIVERYSHVMHIVSNVEARLREGLDAIDVLRASFPAGTVSGAPKVRAMEIIEELEPDKRGIYAGAIGYIGWNGNMDTAISIRTAVIKEGVLHIQAGAGIVADSIPSQEWKETMNKGRAVFRAVAMASAGLENGPSMPRS
jgi:anthranilate synthase component 1